MRYVNNADKLNASTKEEHLNYLREALKNVSNTTNCHSGICFNFKI